MVLLPIAAAAMALNSMLVVGVASYLTERNEVKERQDLSSRPEAVEAISGI